MHRLRIAARHALRATLALGAVCTMFAPSVYAQTPDSEILPQASAGQPVSQPTAARAPLKPNPAFAHYPRYEGMLDGHRIVLRIGVNPDDPDELNGEYQFLPNGPVVLIAGGREGDHLTLEESDDGTEISGQWVGFYATDGSLSGERMNVDQSDPRPFVLKSQ